MQGIKQRQRLGIDAWRKVFHRFERADMTVGEFCKREGLHTSSFRRWQRRLASMAATPLATQAREPREATRQAPTANFIEMGAMSAASQPAGRLEVRLELGGGLVLQLVRG